MIINRFRLILPFLIGQLFIFYSIIVLFLILPPHIGLSESINKTNPKNYKNSDIFDFDINEFFEYVNAKSRIQVKPLDFPINSSYHDFSPTVTQDNNILIFNSNRPFGVGKTDLYECLRTAAGWSEPRNIVELNTKYVDETPFVTPDGKILFFSSNRLGSVSGSSDIYMSRRIGNRWGSPVSVGKGVNTLYSEKTPSLSPNGRYLLFSRYPMGKIRDTRIMVSFLKDNSFSIAVSLPPPINVGAMETCPVFHPSGRGLFFSSFRQGRSWDIYWLPISEKGEFGTPLPLPYPVNSDSNEAFFSVTGDGKKFYFSRLEKNVVKARINYNIYEVSLPEVLKKIKKEVKKDDAVKIRKTRKPSLVIRVFDKERNVPVVANIEVSRPIIEIKKSTKGMRKTRNKIFRAENSHDLTLDSKPGESWSVDIQKKGYMPYSRRIVHGKDEFKIFLQRIKKGKTVVIPNIEFGYNNARLNKFSKIPLERLYGFLKKHPKVNVEISGHTDNIGSEEVEIRLSQERAEVVKNYLIGKGIDGNRLQARGYGANKPIASNDTKKGRKRNRRTEIKILESTPLSSPGLR